MRMTSDSYGLACGLALVWPWLWTGLAWPWPALVCGLAKAWQVILDKMRYLAQRLFGFCAGLVLDS